MLVDKVTFLARNETEKFGKHIKQVRSWYVFSYWDILSSKLKQANAESSIATKYRNGIAIEYMKKQKRIKNKDIHKNMFQK